MSKCPNCGYEIQETNQETEVGVLDEYVGQTKVAVPRVSEYREKFKARKISPQDVTAKPTIRSDLPKLDSELDRFSYEGDSLFFGEGLEVEY